MQLVPSEDRSSHDLLTRFNAVPIRTPPSELQEQRQNSLNDDVFGDDEPSSTEGVRRQHTTEGYREGVTRGKAEQLQEGFDEGYTIGARFGLKVGWVRGALRGLGFAGKTLGGDLKGKFAALKVKAEEELDMNKIFSSEYFDASGIWKYKVGVEDEEKEDYSFDEVVDSHPLIAKWVGIVKEEAKLAGLELQEPRRS